MSERAIPKLYSLQFDSPAALDAAVESLRDSPDVKELLPLATCQRSEVIIVTKANSEALAPLRTQKLKLRALPLEGRDAALRLFQIASGALSYVPGERAIGRQVRAQLRAALKRGDAGSIMATLVRRALKAGDALRLRVERNAPILELAELVAHFVESRQPRPITLLGSGILGRSIAAALAQRNLAPQRWATRSPHPDGPATWSLTDALNELGSDAILITALSGGDTIDPATLPDGLLVIDLGEPPNITARKGAGERARVTSRYARQSLLDACSVDAASLVGQFTDELRPQAEAVERAAHRLPAKAEAALAEILCPRIAEVNCAIAEFRHAIIARELKRLAPALEAMPDNAAEEMRRAIRHTAARCAHPLHEYVNELGRQGRADDAQLIIDHLLGSRIGWSFSKSDSGAVSSNVRSSDR